MCRGSHRRFSTVAAGNGLSKLAVRERTLASLDAATRVRLNELLALGWGDINPENLERRATRSIWHQVLGNCKAEASAQTRAHGQLHGRGSSPLAPSEYLRIG
jgi:integrase